MPKVGSMSRTRPGTTLPDSHRLYLQVKDLGDGSLKLWVSSFFVQSIVPPCAAWLILGTYGQQNEGEGSAFIHGDDEQHAVDSPQLQPDDESFYRRTYNNFLGHSVDDIYGVDLSELLTR